MFEPGKLQYLLEEPDLRSLKREYDPRSLSDLIAWLDTQPADREYAWYDICDCLMHAYFSEGCKLKKAKYHTLFYDRSGALTHYDAAFGFGGGYQAVGLPTPWTMGAALLRARSYQASEAQRLPSILLAEGV